MNCYIHLVNLEMGIMGSCLQKENSYLYTLHFYFNLKVHNFIIPTITSTISLRIFTNENVSNFLYNFSFTINKIKKLIFFFSILYIIY